MTTLESTIGRDRTNLGALVDDRQGKISRRIYVDPEIYALEQERIFRRAWGFLAHESEVPNAGDYIERALAGEPVIIIRGNDGKVRALLNSCRHRGMRVVRADRGNASFLRCPYHGWSYSREGELVQAFAEELYRPEYLEKETLGLIPVTKVQSYKGMIFGSWSADVPDLEQYLGNMKFYLDMLVGRTDSGSEVVGSPHVWDVHANWKFCADNFTGDNFHLYTAHGSVVQLGMLPPDPMSLAYGTLIQAQDGHVLHMVPGPPIPEAEYLGLPKALVPHLQRNLSTTQVELLKNHTFTVGSVFPNFSYLHVMVQGSLDSPPTPFLGFRLWQPTSATSTRIWSWLFVDKEAPQDFRRATYEAYVRTFGPSGIFEQDDMENWEECTRVNTGAIAQRYSLHHGMGLHIPADPNFPGPGTAWPGSYGERTQLCFYAEWKRWMTLEKPWERRAA